VPECIPIDPLPPTTIDIITASGFGFTIGSLTYSNFVVTGATAGGRIDSITDSVTIIATGESLPYCP